MFLDVAESLLEADLFLSFSEDLIRIADRDFLVSAILETWMTAPPHVAMQHQLSTNFQGRGRGGFKQLASIGTRSHTVLQGMFIYWYYVLSTVLPFTSLNFAHYFNL